MNTKKIFTGGINQDDAHILIKENEYLNALNVRIVTSENGKVGFVSNVEGNTIKDFTAPAGVNTTIGVCEDHSRLRLFFFNKNSNGSDGIYCYDSVANVVLTVLLHSNVTGGLSFGSLITSTAIVGDMMYWTDGLVPKRINVEAAIKLNNPLYATTVSAYSAPIAQSVITLIRNQPAYPLTVLKVDVDSAIYPNNFIKDEAFQFAYRFVYRDGEISAFSHWSELVNFNTKDETTNQYRAIDVTVPVEQTIPQDVKRVEVAVRYYLDGRMFVIKRFTSFAGPLTFKFFNDFVGVAVDDATATKQFDPVPLKSLALEVGKDRLFLANNTEGYDTPAITSLTKSVVISDAGATDTAPAVWRRVVFKPRSPGAYEITVYVLDIRGIVDNGYYRTDPITTTPPTSLTTPWAGKQYIGPYMGDLIDYIETNYGPVDFYSFDVFLEVTVTGVPSGQIPSLNGASAFKSSAFYRMGVVFYDTAGRKCGVVTKDDLKFITPDRTYAVPSRVTGVNWSVANNADPLIRQAEIPDWASYYAIVMTKCLRTSFFMQLLADSFKYVSKDPNTGEYAEVSTYSQTLFGTIVSIKSLFSIGYGYTYQEGDIIKLYTNTGVVVSLNIKDTWGEYVVCDLTNLTGVANVLYEIYTPLFSTFDDLYYEVGSVYPINFPGTPERAYSILADTIGGDVYLIQRQRSTPYLVEAMSPNDLMWKNWNVNTGRTNLVTTEGQTRKPANIRFSGVVVLGSETNGLSTFEILDDIALPYEMGDISRIVLTSKVQDEGTVMVAIGKHETASVYLGETQVFDNRGSSFLAKSSGVIGNVNVLKGSFGTINPESVVEWLGDLYWFDANKGVVVRYNANGLFPISSYKMQSYFRKVGEDVLGGLKLFGGVDPYHNEILMLSPLKTSIPQNEVLSDMEYTSTTFSFNEQTEIDLTSLNPGSVYKYVVSGGNTTVRYNDETLSGIFFYNGAIRKLVVFPAIAGTFTITLTECQHSMYSAYDGHGGVYSFQPAIDRWVTRYSFFPQYMSMVANRLVTFYAGKPYVHDSSSMNRFYGLHYDTSVTMVHNEAANGMKKYYNVSVEGSTPDLIHIRTESPYVQSSDLRSGTYSERTRMNGDFTVKEGVSYSEIFRDRLSPNSSGTSSQKLFTGDDMTGEVGLFTVAYKRPAITKSMKIFSIGFIPSRGHTVD